MTPLRTFPALLLLGAVLPAGAQSDAQKGKALFQQNICAHCHSLTDAKTDGTIGPRLDGVGKRLKKDQIEHQITAGGGNMPPFGEALTPEEIHQLVEYLSRAKKEIKTKPKP